MSPRALARRQRRWQLEQQSAELRNRLATHAQATAPVWLWAERARQGSLWLKEHPWVPLLAGVLLVLRRPRRMLRWGASAWGFWKAIRRVRGALEGLQRGVRF